MTTMVDKPTFGTERLARETLIILIETLNDEITHQNEIWAPLDEELATIREQTYEPIELESIEPPNFHLGHKPSLIEAPVEGYPNVSVMSDRAVPSGVDDYDHQSIYDDRLVVEFMVKSLRAENEVNSRVQRLADAINICVMSNRTIRGVVNEFSVTPTLFLSDVFIRSEKTSYGNTWFWQGGRIEYTVQKEAAMPSGSDSRPAALAAPSIDQS